ncbi:hypothetical protein HMI55_007290, partial [Coelomomyces lativittatus]
MVMEDDFNIYDDAYLYGEDESKDSVEPPHVPPPKPSSTSTPTSLTLITSSSSSSSSSLSSSLSLQETMDLPLTTEEVDEDMNTTEDEKRLLQSPHINDMDLEMENMKEESPEIQDQMEEDEVEEEEEEEIHLSDHEPLKTGLTSLKGENDDDVLEGYGESRIEDTLSLPLSSLEEPTLPNQEPTLIPTVEQIYTDANSTAAIQIDELSWWTSDKDIIQIATLATRDSQCVKDVTFSEHKVNGKSRG